MAVSPDAIARRLNPYAAVDPGQSNPNQITTGIPGAQTPNMNGAAYPIQQTPGDGMSQMFNDVNGLQVSQVQGAPPGPNPIWSDLNRTQVSPYNPTTFTPIQSPTNPNAQAAAQPAAATPTTYAGDPNLLTIGLQGATGPGLTDPSQYGTPNANLAMSTLQQMLDPMSYAKLATSIQFDPQIMGVQNQINLARTQADIQQRNIAQGLAGGQQTAQIYQGLGSRDLANAYAQLQQELQQQTGQVGGAFNAALGGVANAYNGAQGDINQYAQQALQGLQGNAQRLGQGNALTDAGNLLQNELSRYGAQTAGQKAQSIGNLATLGAQQFAGASQAQSMASQQLAQRQSDMAQSMLNNVMTLQTQAGQASRGVQEQLSQQVSTLAGQLAGLDSQKAQSLLKSYQDVIGSRYQLERQANLDDLARQISLGTLAIQQGQLGVAQGTLAVNQYLAPAKAEYYSGRGYQATQAGALDAAKVADPSTYLNAGSSTAKPPQGAYGFQQFVSTLSPTNATAAMNLLNASINAAASTAGSNPQQLALAALTNPALASQLGVNLQGIDPAAISNAINIYYGTMYK